MSGSKVLLTYKRKRQSRTDPVQGHECHNSLFVAPDDTSLSKPPDLQVHLIDKRSSEHYNRNSAVCHVCFVCCVGGNLKHCGKCLQSYHLQCLDKPHKENKHIEVSGTRQIPIKTVPTSLDEVPSQRDAYGNKSRKLAHLQMLMLEHWLMIIMLEGDKNHHHQQQHLKEKAALNVMVARQD
ncbi:protein CHROMATIN REMODELING 4-like [Prunus yedoensis var. nudiflora]|uniref:Protein CHROMATIN REMODELING 4-like n=1 Tax=Prunus yedoensis var. nudiflora TaxID=2094558 RepID=A0A314Z6M8_PRUYE|nr:protein CHROMATIN REMODELING 4-like [Prunus yedoensis var. nudiflora]